MIDKLPDNQCCGCSVCHDVCPKGAISMVEDNEGFKHPHIDPALCIHCDLCEKACPVLNADTAPRSEWETPECYAANHRSYEVRFRSTSGGVFSALATQMYREGGYVGGAAADTLASAKQIISNNPEDLQKLRRSKYMQSDAQGYYAEIKRLLKAGEKVLAVGTPCMIAGLNQFLKKDFPNLLTVDFVCNNVNSPKIHRYFLDYEERLMGSKLIYRHAKDKEISWHGLTSRYDFKNGKTLYKKGRDGGHSLSSRVYHSHVAGRPSCASCPFKGFPRYADISLGDYWGAENYHPALCDDMGTSLVMVNSAKGHAFFEKVKKQFILEDSKKEWIVAGNPAITKPNVNADIDRKAFFAALDAGEKIEDLMDKLFPRPATRKLGKGAKLKAALNIIRRRILPRLKKYTHYRPSLLWQFFRLNFCNKAVHTNWRQCGFIFPSSHCLIDIDKSAHVILEGPLGVGCKKQWNSSVETRLLVEAGGTLRVSGDFHFGYGSDVEVLRNAVLELDSGGVNCNLTLICAQKIELRGDVRIGRDVSIRDTNAHIIAIDGYKVTAPVIIENHTWLCSGCNINPGSKVGVGSIVGGMANLSGRVPAHCLAVGNPAKVVMKDIMWKY